MKFDQQTNQAILALNDNPHWRIFIEALAAESEILNETYVLGELPDLKQRILQGRTKQCVLILKACVEARDNLNNQGETHAT